MNKTVLITNGNILSLLSLGYWIKKYGFSSLLSIFITTKLPSSKSNIREMLSMLHYSGFHYSYFKIWVNRIVPLILKYQKLPCNVCNYCKYLGLPIKIHYVDDINGKECVERISSYKPEILLSFSATQKFKLDLLKIPMRIAINAHFALLPQYAGISPYFWYLNNNEKECGTTLHTMTEKLDAGPIIEQTRFPIEKNRSVLSVALKQAATISPMLNNFYGNKTNERDASLQDLSMRSYFRHPRKEVIKPFLKKGYTFMNGEDKKQIINAVRTLV
jgi:methionyl-tRNA formyltransferase